MSNVDRYVSVLKVSTGKGVMISEKTATVLDDITKDQPPATSNPGTEIEKLKALMRGKFI
jgi:hypothetical protein